MISGIHVPSLVEIWTSSTSTCFSVSVMGTVFLAETSSSVMVIFSFSARETFQTFVSEGFCRPWAGSSISSAVGTSTSVWEQATSSLAGPWAPAPEPLSPPGRQSDLRPCDGGRSWRPPPSRIQCRRNLHRNSKTRPSDRARNVTFVEPRPHPLAAKLNILDLPEIGEDLLEMIFVDIPGESPDVNLSGWR